MTNSVLLATGMDDDLREILATRRTKLGEGTSDIDPSDKISDLTNKLRHSELELQKLHQKMKSLENDVEEKDKKITKLNSDLTSDIYFARSTNTVSKLNQTLLDKEQTIQDLKKQLEEKDASKNSTGGSPLEDQKLRSQLIQQLDRAVELEREKDDQISKLKRQLIDQGMSLK